MHICDYVSICYQTDSDNAVVVFKKLIIKGILHYSQHKRKRTRHHRMSTKTCQAEMTTVFFATVDGATSGTISVLTTGSPSSPEGALKTHLQSTFGWRPDDIVLEMYEPDKYVILFDTVASKFIREECSVAAATTEADKYTVQKELCAYIKRYNIRELDLNEIYSHYNISTIRAKCFSEL